MPFKAAASICRRNSNMAWVLPVASLRQNPVLAAALTAAFRGAAATAYLFAGGCLDALGRLAHDAARRCRSRLALAPPRRALAGRCLQDLLQHALNDLSDAVTDPIRRILSPQSFGFRRFCSLRSLNQRNSRLASATCGGKPPIE